MSSSVDIDMKATSEAIESPKVRGSLGATVTRLVLGFTTLAVWIDNISKDFYDGENFPGFFDFQFRSPESEGGGNGSTLTFVQDILDATILQAPEFFGWILTFVELGIALSLIFGIFTRAGSIAAIGFFIGLFLVYFGGEEWIWTYVLLLGAAVAIFLDWGGRLLGVDQYIAKVKGESPFGLIW